MYMLEDIIVLWTKPIHNPLRCCRSCDWQKTYTCKLAVGSLQLVGCWTAGRSFGQRLHSRSIWVQTYDDGFHGLDGRCPLHSRVFPVDVGPRFW